MKSEILRRIACSLIIVFGATTFTGLAQSKGTNNLFKNRAVSSKSAEKAAYYPRKAVRKARHKKIKRRVAARKVRKSYRARKSYRKVRRANKRKYRSKRLSKRTYRKRIYRKSKPVFRKSVYRKNGRRVTAKRRLRRAVVPLPAKRRLRKRTTRRYTRKNRQVRRKSGFVRKVSFKRSPRHTIRPVRRRKSARSSVSGSSRYSDLIAKHASRYGVPVKLAHAVVRIESNYRAGVRGGAGEIGLMQIKPATARLMGYRGSAKALYNPDTNLKYGMKYLAGAYKRSGGSVCGTVLRYNAGHGAKRMNPISARYCRKAKRILGTQRIVRSAPVSQGFPFEDL